MALQDPNFLDEARQKDSFLYNIIKDLEEQKIPY